MRVAEEGRLYRRGAQGEQSKAVRRGVAGEVDEDVHLIGENRLLQRRIVKGRRFAPAIGTASRLAGVGVVHVAGVVDGDLETAMVVAQEHRQHEEIDRVLPVQVAGDVADAQAPSGRACVREVGFLGHRGFDRRAQAAMQGGDVGRRQLVVIERGHRHARGEARQRVAAGIGGLQGGEVSPRIAHPPVQSGFEQGRFRVRGRQRLETLEARAAVGEGIDLRLDAGQREPGRDVLRAQRERLVEDGDRLLPVVVRIDARREVEQEVRVGRQRGAAEGFLGGRDVADAQQGFAEIHHRTVAQGADVDQAGEGGDRALGVAGVQAPDAEPVQALAGDRFERRGARQRLGVGGRRCRRLGRGRLLGNERLQFVQTGEVQPGQPVPRAGARSRRELLDQGAGLRQRRPAELRVACRGILPGTEVEGVELRSQIRIAAQRLPGGIAGLPGQGMVSIVGGECEPHTGLPGGRAQLPPKLGGIDRRGASQGAVGLRVVAHRRGAC